MAATAAIFAALPLLDPDGDVDDKVVFIVFTNPAIFGTLACLYTILFCTPLSSLPLRDVLAAFFTRSARVPVSRTPVAVLTEKKPWHPFKCVPLVSPGATPGDGCSPHSVAGTISGQCS